MRKVHFGSDDPEITQELLFGEEAAERKNEDSS